MWEERVMDEAKEKSKEEAEVRSRRSMLKGSAALIAGGVAGIVGSAYASSPEPKFAPAPPLPWKWTQLDPMEAGTRAYKNYLTNKG